MTRGLLHRVITITWDCLTHTHYVMTLQHVFLLDYVTIQTDTYSFTQPAESTQQHGPAVRYNKTCTCMVRLHKSLRESIASFTVHWFPLTMSKWMQKKLLVLVDVLVTELFNITGSYFNAKKPAHCSRVLVVTELVVSGSQRIYNETNLHLIGAHITVWESHCKGSVALEWLLRVNVCEWVSA